MGRGHMRGRRAVLSLLALIAVLMVVPGLSACAPATVAEAGDAAAQGSGEGAPDEFVVVAEGLSIFRSDALANSLYLQKVLDTLSRGGGGTVIVPAGTYRFAATGTHSLGDYAVEARSNVKIVGAGEGSTIFMPVGLWSKTGRYEHGIDMFAYSGMKTGEYLVNADFEGFTIDSAETQGSPEGYNASGKGFFFKLFKDCDWANVEVRNTDGTGFGMDFPINCTMRDCVAVGCGKNAGHDDAGASGFGIGTGYSGLESMTIVDCESRDNAKFGFFFEHQTRFNSRVEALSAVGYRVIDCEASGNLYNFGGARAHDVSYEGCVSAISDDPEREAYNVRAFCFENHSYRTKLIDCTVEQRYADVPETAPYFDATCWALDEGLLESSSAGDEVLALRPDDVMLRGEAATLLWRYAGRPGDVVFDGLPDMAGDYVDVVEGDYYIDAALWMGSLSDVSLDEFRGNDPITKAELVTMIWRMERCPLVMTFPEFVDVEEDSYYAQALAWAVRQGFISDDSSKFDPRATCTRADVLMMLHACDASLVDGLVGEPSDGMEERVVQELHDVLGSVLKPRAAYAGFYDEEMSG